MSVFFNLPHDDTLLWQQCSDFWLERLNNKAEASRCLQEAEGLAAKAKDFLHLAHSWLILGENENGKRCLILCEANPGVDARILTWVADMWSSSLLDTESAIRCLHKAEAIAQYPAEWSWCADSWQKLGKQKELFCIEKEAEVAKRAGTDLVLAQRIVDLRRELGMAESQT